MEYVATEERSLKTLVAIFLADRICSGLDRDSDILLHMLRGATRRILCSRISLL